MRYFISLLFVCCIAVITQAQTPLSVQGFVRDTTREPIAYCTVTLLALRDSTLLSGATTLPDGSYVLSVKQAGDYLLRYDHLAYDPQYKMVGVAGQETLSDVILEAAVVRIDDVVIVAKNITYKAGKYEFNMTDPLAQNRSAMQVLELLPGLKNTDNTITLKNEPVAMIYIDDRLVTDQSELAALRAEQISSIEVQNNAGAAYSATMQGGIVRIRLKKLADGSFYGNVNSEISVSRSAFYMGIGIPFAAQYKRLNIYNYVSTRYQEKSTLDLTHAEYRNSGYALDSEDIGFGAYRHINEVLSLMYDINDHHTIGVSGQILMGLSEVSNTVGTTASALAGEQTPDMPDAGYTRYRYGGDVYNRQYLASLNYIYRIDSLGSRLTFKADYQHYNIAKNYDYDTRGYRLPDDNSELYSVLSQERYKPLGNTLRSRLDFNKNLTDERTISAGLAYDIQYVDNDNRILGYDGDEWVADPDQSFRFIDHMYEAAAYADWADSYDKFSYNLGLRFQWNRISYRNADGIGYKNRDYWRLFPELSLAYIFNDSKGNHINLDVSRYSGSLPGNDDLSPRRVWSSPYSYYVGNESLDPAHGYDLDLTYTLHNEWYFSYIFSNDHYSESLAFYDPKNPDIIYTTPVNGAKSISHTLWANYMASLTKWLRVDIWTSRSWRRLNFNESSEESWWGQIGAQLIFQPFQTMRASLSGGLQSPVKRLEYRQNETYYLHVSLDKSFFNNKLQLSLGVYGIVYNKMEQTTERLDGSYYAVLLQPKGYRELRMVFSAAWNFNHNAKQQVKQVESMQQQNEVLK